jgi:O-antigen/teichoic acid export membrane protein
MNQGLLEALFVQGGFSPQNFPDLFDPVWIASLGLLVVAVVLYNVQVRRLHRHPPLVALQEWLLWTAIAVFGLLLVYAIFKFYFIFVLITVVVGLATFVWIRFIRFPPLIRAYNVQVQRARSMTQARYRRPEATIRPRKTRQRRRR